MSAKNFKNQFKYVFEVDGVCRKSVGLKVNSPVHPLLIEDNRQQSDIVNMRHMLKFVYA